MMSPALRGAIWNGWQSLSLMEIRRSACSVRKRIRNCGMIFLMLASRCWVFVWIRPRNGGLASRPDGLRKSEYCTVCRLSRCRSTDDTHFFAIGKWTMPDSAEQASRVSVELKIQEGGPIVLLHRVGRGQVASLLSAPQNRHGA